MSTYLASKEIGQCLKGPHPSIVSQAEVEKLDTGKNSSENSTSDRGWKRLRDSSEEELAVGDGAA